MALAALPTLPALRPACLLRVMGQEPLLAGATLCLLAMIPPTLVALALDPRTLHGINVWVKPLKFEIALAVYLGTLAWFASWLPPGMPQRPWFRRYTAVVVFCIAAELIWILGAAAYGVGSHFNRATPALATLYGLMGLFAVVLTSLSLAYAVLIARHPAPLDPVLRLALVSGLGLTFVLTVLVAGYMASGTGHWVGGQRSDQAGLALMGWARAGGDLRVAHFFATHAMHALPLFGLTASRLLAPAAGRLAVWLFSGLYTAGVLYTFSAALAGQPFLAWLG